MARINWGRVAGGGALAAIICFVTDGFLHEQVLGADWKAIYDNLRTSPPDHGSVGLAYFAVFDGGRGLLSIFLYALMRSPFGPGPRTAAMAGVAAWIAFSIAGPAQFIPLGFYSDALWVKVAVFQLVTSIVAAIAGAGLYREAATTGSAPSGA